MGMILRIASSRIVGQGDIVGRSGYFSLNLSANSVMRGRLDARRTLKSLVADLRIEKKVSRLKPSKLQLFFLLKYFKSSELITLVNAYWRGLIYTVKLCLELRFHSFLSSQFYH